VVCREGAAEPLVLLIGRSGCNEAVDCAPAGVEGVSAPFVLLEEPAADTEGRFALLPFAIGALRLVERLRISLPLTTILSLDLRRSRVSISGPVSTTSQRILVICLLTVTASIQVHDASNTHVHNAEEALILLLELLLVEDLDRQDTLLIHSPDNMSVYALFLLRSGMGRTCRSSHSSMGSASF